ncbi:MAG: hypothetical protein NZ530_05850 [Thermodesulfobacteriaceae bacterium]|nr:hypothetical protein [Thermodesulfobacteriaceae bacterium]
MRTFNEWDENRVGFLEVDLVAHTTKHCRGEFFYTLCAVDISSRWTEVYILRNRA